MLERQSTYAEMSTASSTIWCNFSKSEEIFPLPIIYFWEIMSIEVTTQLKQFACYCVWKSDTKKDSLF